MGLVYKGTRRQIDENKGFRSWIGSVYLLMLLNVLHLTGNEEQETIQLGNLRTNKLTGEEVLGQI